MMLADLDKLNTLRLGPNFLYELTTYTELNTEGIWLNVGNQTETELTMVDGKDGILKN